jgi:hypothetical protein
MLKISLENVTSEEKSSEVFKSGDSTALWLI